MDEKVTDEQFLADFEALKWPLEKWHHRDHVKLAYIYLRKYSLEDASVKIRDGIKAHNAANQIPESLTGGYHETMTQAWLRLVHYAIEYSGPAENADAFYEAHPELWQMKVLRFFYSKGRFLTMEAKGTFVEPDITPLPRRQR